MKYSVIEVNQRLNRVARDMTFTQFLDFTKILSDNANCQSATLIVDRICLDIIPRIENSINPLDTEMIYIPPSIFHDICFFLKYHLARS